VILLDDFLGEKSGMELSQLLTILDRYPVDVECKGGHLSLNAARIFFVTSNCHPARWYKDWPCDDSYVALARRFHGVITWIKSPGDLQHRPRWLDDQHFWFPQESNKTPTPMQWIPESFSSVPVNGNVVEELEDDLRAALREQQTLATAKVKPEVIDLTSDDDE